MMAGVNTLQKAAEGRAWETAAVGWVAEGTAVEVVAVVWTVATAEHHTQSVDPRALRARESACVARAPCMRADR